MKTTITSIPTDTVIKLVQCVENAVGDDILADIRKSGLVTSNSIPARIWDILNTNLATTLATEDCTVASAKRGPWEMMIVFEKTSQCVITFMREKRFAELRKKQSRRACMHYVDMLAKQFNSDLLSNQQQFGFATPTFSDEHKLSDLVQCLLSDLKDDVDIVRHHILVLFETSGCKLTSIRAIMVTPSLDIADGCEQNWSKYITANESLIVEKVSNPTAPTNQPTHGLALKSKAIARQKNNLQKKNAQNPVVTLDSK